MGTELQAKYSKLTQEYAKLRAQVDVLKKAVRDEKTQKDVLEESLRERSQNLRKHVQENESLEFRNHQLSRRVALLQEELAIPNKKKKKGQDGISIAGVSEIHTQELASKIAEIEKLHMKVLELNQKSERTIQGLKMKVGTLEAEVTSHYAAVDELNREHSAQVDELTEQKALMEVKMLQHKEETEDLKSNLDRLQTAASEWRRKTLSGQEQKTLGGTLLVDADPSCISLNIPVVDTRLQAEVLVAMKGCVALVNTISTQLSTFHSYLEQRCKCYPVDVSSGLHMSVVNLKLCELLHSSSSYTRPLASSLSSYYDKLEADPFSQTVSSDLGKFANTHHMLVNYLETLTPYLQQSLHEENCEFICGANLTALNQSISMSFPLFTRAFKSMNDYIIIIITGQSENIPVTNVKFCLEKLNSSLRILQDSITALSAFFSSKVSLEAQLPTATSKLSTTNECVIAVLNGILSTAQELSGCLERNSVVFEAAIEKNALSLSENLNLSQCTLVQSLRGRATNYLRKLRKDCPASVPYTLAVHHSSSLSSSTESNQTLMKQVSAGKERLSHLEQEKEQLIVDLQLLAIKYEKEQKKTSSLEDELSRLCQVGVTSLSVPFSTSSLARSASPSPAPSDTNLPANDSLGSLSMLSSEDEDSVDDTALMRKFFVDRITKLNNQIQESDSKAAHYYAECRALQRQISHNTALRNKLTHDLQTANDCVQDLQDQLMTTCSNYEKQLSTMSDHVCELNDKLINQSEKLDVFKKSAKGKKRGK